MEHESNRARPSGGGRFEVRFDWWEQLLAEARSRTALHSGCKPLQGAVLRESASSPHLAYIYVVNERTAKAELWFGGAVDDAALKSRFDWYLSQRRSVDAALPGLQWERLDHRLGSRIFSRIEGGFRTPRGEWPKVHRDLVGKMIQLEAVMRPLIEKESSDGAGGQLGFGAGHPRH